MPRSNAKPTKQHARFVEKAREIGADEERSAADALLGRLVQMPKATKEKRAVSGETTRQRSGQKPDKRGSTG
jgi:hypothetical protein